MATFILDGNGVPPSEVLKVLTWEESKHLANLIVERRNEQNKAEGENQGKIIEAILQGMSGIHESISVLNKNVVSYINAKARAG